MRGKKSQPAAAAPCGVYGFFRGHSQWCATREPDRPAAAQPSAGEQYAKTYAEAHGQTRAPQIAGTSCVGYADPMEHERLLLEVGSLRKERDTLRAQLAEAEKALEKIRVASKAILHPMCDYSVRARHYDDILNALKEQP